MSKATVDRQRSYSVARTRMGRVDPTAVWLYNYGYGYANLARLVPWDQQIQLHKYAKKNPEPD